VGPESAGTVSFVRTLSVRRQFQRFCDESGINDSFCSQTPRFREMLIMFPSANNVESAARSESGVSGTKLRDGAAGIDPALIDSEFLLRPGIIVDRHGCCGRERHQPECVSGLQTKRTGPNARLVASYVV
jgi:hypothetical protein